MISVECPTNFEFGANIFNVVYAVYWFCCVFDLARGWCAEVGATASAKSVPATKAGQAKHATARLTQRQIKWDTG